MLIQIIIIFFCFENKLIAMNIKHYDLQHEMQFWIENSGEVAGCLISSLMMSGYSKIYIITNSINSNISMIEPKIPITWENC